MRVLLIPSAYPPRLGGVQTVSHTLAQHLVQKGHEVQVVTNHYPRSLPVRECIDGVNIERILFLTPTVSSLRRGRFDLFLASLYFSPSAHRRLHNIARRFHPDVVNVHFPDHQIPFVLSLRQGFDVRLVVSLHGHDIDRIATDELRSGKSPYTHTALNRLQKILSNADAVTACSHYLLEKAIRVEPSIAAKARVIHNGVDPHRFQDKTPYLSPRPYVLAIGRLVHSKGFDMLLEAFAKTESQIDLIIAGEGEDRASLENQARQLGLVERIQFFGPATPEQVVLLLNGALLVVIPSRIESFGIVALEALAAGKPVLASRVGGLAELLTSIGRELDQGASPTSLSTECSSAVSAQRNKFAMLVEPNAGALAKGLDQALHSSHHYDDVSKFLFTNYSWERMVDEYEAVMMH